MMLRALLCLLMLAVAAAPSWAQTPRQPPKPTAKPPAKVKKDPKWTFEVFGGGGFGGGTGGDATADFPAGEAFTTVAGRPSRVVPSWYFGDGARLFNEVRAQFSSQFGVTFPQIVSMDPVFSEGVATRSGGPAFGFRLTRRLTPRYALEFGLQRSNSTLDISDSARSAIEASSASFDEAFSGLIGTIPQAGMQVTSQVEAPDDASASQTALTAVLNIALWPGRRPLSPYVSAGVGYVTNDAESLHLRVVGNYQFRFLDTNPFNETDTVTLRTTDSDSSVIGVFGGGAIYELSARQGLRFDVRVHAAGNDLITKLDAAPTVAGLTPPLALPSNTTPSIQFSSTAQFKSSLSGRINDQTVFTGGGLDMRVHVSIGYFFRF
jgi:hypothetical protein